MNFLGGNKARPVAYAPRHFPGQTHRLPPIMPRRPVPRHALASRPPPPPLRWRRLD
jgi:hypothetical protein